jgi:hypothetical protein
MTTDSGNTTVEPKAAFIKPQLVCYGAVADLTARFGGSITPEDREAQGLE